MTASRPFTPETLSAPQDVNEAIRIIRELLGDAPWDEVTGGPNT